MPPPDPNDYQDNGMQRNAGLIPPMFGPPVMASYPGQTAAAVAQYFQTGIPGGSMGGGGFPNAFPQPMPTFTTASPFMPGPSGVMMPMYGAAPSNPFGMGGGRPAMGGGSMYGGGPMGPPPAYAGPQGQAPVLFSPQIPQGFFDTPFQTAQRQQFATEQRMSALGVGAQGIGARMGMDLAAGYAGFRAGGVLGGLAGFAGSELLGLGRGAQNMFMRNFGAPQLNTQAYGAAIQDMSSSFMSGGPNGAMTGSGFTRTAALNSASMLTDMAGSRDFRQSTFNRFNTSDVMRIAQGGAEAGLMQGVQSPEQMRDRVRQLAQSLTSFMELAQEPDVRRAIQTMGNMQMQGLNINETMQAVRNGRTFARAAGMSFNAMAEAGGGMGAQTFQSLGLTQGLGFQTGMQNLGLAGMSQNLRTLNPQMMNLVGGAQGLASMNTMFSAGMLQMPMMAPGVMTANGGIDVNAMRGLMSGGADIFGMTGRGASTLGTMGRRMGVEGLGMALAMQPMLQDTMGRMLQSQGPFAQRNFEDMSTMNLMRNMRQRGSAGFITAAQMSGMGQSQALARAMEVGDPRFWARQRDQLASRATERAGEDIRREDAEGQTSWLDELTSASSTVADTRRWFSGLGRGLRRVGETFTRGFGRDTPAAFDSRASRQFAREASRTDEFWEGLRGFTRGGSSQRSLGGGLDFDVELARQQGARGLFAGLTGVTMDPAMRELEGRRFEQRGTFARGVLTARTMGADEQVRSQRDVFGSVDAARAFQREALQTLGDQGNQQGRLLANTAWRATVGAAGMFTPAGRAADMVGALPTGNIVGRSGFDIEAIQRSMVQNVMRGRGVGERAAQDIVRQNMPAIMSQLRDEVETTGTRDQIRALRDARAAWERQEDPTVRNAGERGYAMQRRATEGLLGLQENALTGRQGREVTTQVMRAIDNAGEGVGGTSRQRQQSRGIIFQMAALGRIARGSGNWSSEQRAQASAQIRALRGEAQRQLGLNDEQGTSLTRAAARLEGTAHITAEVEAQGAALLNVDPRTAVRRGATAGAEGQRGQQYADIAVGMRTMAGFGNEVGGIFAAAGQDPDAALRALGDIGNDRTRLDALRRQDRSLADAAVAAARGNTGRAREIFTQRTQAAGRATAAVDEALGSTEGIWGSIRSFFGIGRGERNRMVQRAMADPNFNRQMGENVATEQAATDAGVGGPNDQLVTAARELRAAARLLSGAAESGQLDDLTE